MVYGRKRSCCVLLWSGDAGKRARWRTAACRDFLPRRAGDCAVERLTEPGKPAASSKVEPAPNADANASSRMMEGCPWLKGRRRSHGRRVHAMLGQVPWFSCREVDLSQPYRKTGRG